MAQVALVYVQPDAKARIVGSFSDGVQVRAMGSDRATSRFQENTLPEIPVQQQLGH